VVWVVGLAKHLAFLVLGGSIHRGLADRIDKAITASRGQGASTNGVGFGDLFLGG